jgi:hypothetical protein
MIERVADSEEDPQEGKFIFKSIEGHQGPLKPNHPDYKGSSYNLLVRWDDGSETYEPLEMFIKDDPITVALYARKHNLLNLPGWKRLKYIASKIVRDKRSLRQTIHCIHISQGKRTSGPIYQFGIQVPKNVKEAYKLDAQNGNTLWEDAMKEEIQSLLDFNTFEDKGKVPFIDGFKNIIVHFVFAVKHDLRHKACLVAGGHLTEPTGSNSYSGVVSFRSM